MRKIPGDPTRVGVHGVTHGGVECKPFSDPRRELLEMIREVRDATEEERFPNIHRYANDSDLASWISPSDALMDELRWIAFDRD